MLDDLVNIEDEFNLKKERTYIFVPADGKDMRVAYPELATIDSFNLLTDKELTFVWLISNKTSPLAKENRKVSDTIAIKQALEWSKLDKYLTAQESLDYRAEKYPSKIQGAINKMSTFNPSTRMKAKIITEKVFNNISKMVDVSEEELQNMSLQEKKSYADFAKTVTNTLDELIIANEEAYGVKTVKKREQKSASSGKTLMDLIMTS